MTPQPLPCPPPVCPRCGVPMKTIVLALPSPPYSAKLTGCARCGITANELPAADAPPGGVLPGLRRKR